MILPSTAPTEAQQMRCGFLRSTASNFWSFLNMLVFGVGGWGLNRSEGANFALFIVFAKNLGHEVAFKVKPIGGYNIPPVYSQCPYSFSSSLSTNFQKSDF